MLWGLYHGLLVVSTRSAGRVLRLPGRWPGALGGVQIAATIALMMAGWVFFRETDADFLLRHLRLSPADRTREEREIGMYLFAVAATWALPLVVDDLWALARARRMRVMEWFERQVGDYALLGGQMAGAGALVTLTLVLRSRVSLDFIYFRF